MELPTHLITDDVTWFLVTMQQFEDLTNEVTTAVNELMSPHFASGDYIAQVTMAALHSKPHDQGTYSKQDILFSVINRISCHLTYDAVQNIQQKIKAEAGLKAVPEVDTAVADEPQEVV